MSVETDPHLGMDLAGYRIERVLGPGGMGVVYVAEDLRLNTITVVRVPTAIAVGTGAV